MMSLFQICSEDGITSHQECEIAALSGRRRVRRSDDRQAFRIEAFRERRCRRLRVPVQMRRACPARQANAHKERETVLRLRYRGHVTRRGVAPSALQNVAAYDRPLQQPREQILSGLRRAGDQGLQSVDRRRGRQNRTRMLRPRYGQSSSPRFDARAVEYGRALFSGKLLMGEPGHSGAQSTRCAYDHISRSHAGAIGMGAGNGYPLFHVGSSIGKRLGYRAGVDGARSVLLNGQAQRLQYINRALAVLA